MLPSWSIRALLPSVHNSLLYVRPITGSNDRLKAKDVEVNINKTHSIRCDPDPIEITNPLQSYDAFLRDWEIQVQRYKNIKPYSDMVHRANKWETPNLFARRTITLVDVKGLLSIWLLLILINIKDFSRSDPLLSSTHPSPSSLASPTCFAASQHRQHTREYVCL